MITERAEEILKPTLMDNMRSTCIRLGVMMALMLLAIPQISQAETAAEINRDVDIALKTLYKSTPAAKKMSEIAKGILVFPSIIKGGFIIGGQYGEGALRVGGKTTGYYRTVAASYGLQAGAQSFGYAMFFLSDDDLKYLKKSEGWEVGVGPTVVVMDEGMSRSFSTTTAKSGVYAFFFDQKGLMAGLGIQGSKISKIQPDK
ncbi:MAG: twin-arginine translocation pathway signal protein [Desulfobulbaceae bacterium]|nr:twin-arginine translocation pathway signal protein [Desulfobulbaceae bacterium]